MKSLLFTLSAFFVLVFGTLALDKFCNGTLTGRGLAGSLAIALILTWWHIYRQRQRTKELDRQEALRKRAVAEMVVTSYRRSLGQRGRVPLVIPVAFAVGIVTGHLVAGSGEPSSFWLMAVALLLLGAFVARSRRPRRNRRKVRGIIGRTLAWRQVRKAARSVRLVEVNR